MSTHPPVRQTIIRLLSCMASGKEISQYLRRFSRLDASRFAIVKVGGAVILDALEAVTSSLTFLQEVGLTPIVIHGAGPQLNAQMLAANMPNHTIHGLRVTSGEALALVRQTIALCNAQLVAALHDQGARALAITNGVFECSLIDPATYGYVGQVEKVHFPLIEASLRAGSIPVIASLGETPDGQIVNINADVAANQLVQTVQPYKIIFLTSTGGLLDANGAIIDSINLSTEYADLMSQSWLHGGMKLKIKEIKSLLDHLPGDSSVSITHPADLAKELFTHKGSGTLVRRGEQILTATHWDAIDRSRLRQLIESSFGYPLTLDYFTVTPLKRLYFSENYRAAVVLCEIEGVTYLDKFVVHDDAQGEGLGRAVWNYMRERTSQLFWRSRHQNRINPFYYAESDGCLKIEHWQVFWYGFTDFDQIQRCVHFCATRQPTMVSA